MVDNEKFLLDKLFENFVSLLRVRLKESSQDEVARLLKCSQSTISRWLTYERKPGLKYLLDAYKKLGGGEMNQILTEVLGEEKAAILLSVGDDDPEFFEALLSLLATKNEEYEKLKSDVLYYYRKK